MLTLNSLLASRYLILQKVGQGGMGAVYKAADTRLGNKIVAVKELSESNLSDPADRQQARQAFEAEARILAQLEHPNLPRVSDHFSEGSRQYLVMDFVDGKTLEQTLAATKGPLDVKQVVDWAGQLCDVLTYLHDQRPPVIFRDLKPANIMVDSDGKIKLIDFGIARHFKAGKASDTTMFGTPGYAPPEQYGMGQTDARSDIYALGATLHHLLTGRHPGDNPFTFASVRSLNPRVPETVEHAIMKAVEQDPARRWQSVHQMRQALIAPSSGHAQQSGPTVGTLPTRPSAVPSPHHPTPKISAAGSLAGQTLRRLDFGVMLPCKVRWLPLDIGNRDRRRSYQLKSSQSWIHVNPMTLECRANERRRVRVSVDTKAMQADTGNREHGQVMVITDQTSHQVAVSVRVESMAGIYSLLRFMFNILLGLLCGGLLLGGGGNLALVLGGLNASALLLLWGAIAGGLAISLAGTRMQDTANLVLALLVSAVVLGITAALVGAVFGLLVTLAVGQGHLVGAFASVGLCVGITGGMIYAIRTPERWGMWPF